MAEDVSNRTVVILVVLTIIISTLGTLTVSSSVVSFKDAQVPDGGSRVQSGKVSLSIVGDDAPEPVQRSAAPVTGNVILRVK